jgi:hypothetical protein
LPPGAGPINSELRILVRSRSLRILIIYQRFEENLEKKFGNLSSLMIYYRYQFDNIYSFFIGLKNEQVGSGAGTVVN